jgi:hypothetical protein
MRSRLVLPLPLRPVMRSASPGSRVNDRPVNSVLPPRAHSSAWAASVN